MDSGVYEAKSKVCCSILSELFEEAAHLWGCSSVGRAPALQAGGHGFESHHLHPETDYLVERTDFTVEG